MRTFQFFYAELLFCKSKQDLALWFSLLCFDAITWMLRLLFSWRENFVFKLIIFSKSCITFPLTNQMIGVPRANTICFIHLIIQKKKQPWISFECILFHFLSFSNSPKLSAMCESTVRSEWCVSHWFERQFFQSKLSIWLSKQRELSMDNFCSARLSNPARFHDIYFGNLFGVLFVWSRHNKGWQRWQFAKVGRILREQQTSANLFKWKVHVGGIWQWSKIERPRVFSDIHCYWWEPRNSVALTRLERVFRGGEDKTQSPTTWSTLWST